MLPQIFQKAKAQGAPKLGGLTRGCLGFTVFSVFDCVMDCSFVAGVFECCFGGSGG